MIDCLPILAISVSILGAILIVLIGNKNPNLRESVSIIAGILKFTFVIMMIPPFLKVKKSQ